MPKKRRSIPISENSRTSPRRRPIPPRSPRPLLGKIPRAISQPPPSPMTYSREFLLGLRPKTMPLSKCSAPPRLPVHALRDLEISTFSQLWRAREVLLLRERISLDSREIMRIEPGTFLLAVGGVGRVDFDIGNSYTPPTLVRLEVEIWAHEEDELTRPVPFRGSVRSLPVSQNRRGWVTASSTACFGGKIYVEPPLFQRIHSAGFSSFLLTPGVLWQLIDDLIVYDDEGKGVGHLEWGWVVRQEGFPRIDGEKIKIKISFPCVGWLIAVDGTRRGGSGSPEKIHSAEFMQAFEDAGWLALKSKSRSNSVIGSPRQSEAGNSEAEKQISNQSHPGIFVRPFESEMPSGASGRIRACSQNYLQTGVDPCSQTIGPPVPAGRFLEIMGPCVMVGFQQGGVKGKVVRAPVTDGRLVLSVPRWATISYLRSDDLFDIKTNSSVVKQYELADSKKLNPRASDFVQNCRRHDGLVDSDAFMFTPRDGPFGDWGVIYPVKAFEAGSLFAKAIGSFPVGRSLTQRNPAVWREECVDGVRVYCLWLSVLNKGLVIKNLEIATISEEDLVWVPVMEIRQLSGRHVTYMRRLGDCVNCVKTAPHLISLASSINEENDKNRLTKIVQVMLGAKAIAEQDTLVDMKIAS